MDHITTAILVMVARQAPLVHHPILKVSNFDKKNDKTKKNSQFFGFCFSKNKKKNLLTFFLREVEVENLKKKLKVLSVTMICIVIIQMDTSWSIFNFLDFFFKLLFR